MPTEPSMWVELVKTFGLPTVLLGITAWVLYSKDQWIQNELVSLIKQTTAVISNNTSALEANTSTQQKVHDALDKRAPGSV